MFQTQETIWCLISHLIVCLHLYFILHESATSLGLMKTRVDMRNTEVSHEHHEEHSWSRIGTCQKFVDAWEHQRIFPLLDSVPGLWRQVTWWERWKVRTGRWVLISQSRLEIHLACKRPEQGSSGREQHPASKERPQPHLVRGREVKAWETKAPKEETEKAPWRPGRWRWL